MKHRRPAGRVVTVAALAASVPAAALGDAPTLVTASAASFVLSNATDDGRSSTEPPAKDWDGLVSLAMGYLETAGHTDRAAPREPDPAPTT